MSGWMPLEPEDVGKVVRIVQMSGEESCGRVAAWSVDPDHCHIAIQWEHGGSAHSFPIDRIERVYTYGGRAPSIHTNPAILTNVTVQTVTNQHTTTIREDVARRWLRYREGGEV